MRAVRVIGCAVLLVAVVAASVLGDDAEKSKTKPVDSLARAKATIELEGPIHDAIGGVTANWLIRAPRDNPAMLTMLADRDTNPHENLLPWSGEFAGKYLTGVVQTLRVTGDPQLRKAAEQFVAQLLPLQAEDGYFGPFPREWRLTGKAPSTRGGKVGPTWDLWGHYHMMLGLLLWHEETGCEKSLAAAKRIGDLLCEKFLESDVPVSSTGSTEMNQAVVHSLALLYRVTKDDKYRNLAEEVVHDFAAPGAGDYLRMGLKGAHFYELPKPRWESLHPIMGLVELYRLTGNERYRTAFENLWWSIVETDRHNNGGFSSGEQAQGNPYDQGPIETCCTIAWMAMSVEMLRLTGDSRVADELELSTLNQIVGTFSPDGSWSTYNTPMDGRRIPSTQDIAFQIRPGSEELNCCSVNAARGYGMLSDWALMQSADGLALNWYGPSTMTSEVGGTKVSLRQKTDYPQSGHIELAVDPAEAKAFELKLRIPHWSANTKVSVNGEAQSADPGKYLSIDRTWKPGDKVTIDLDMSPRYWVGKRECEGKASVYRGPILLVFEGPRRSVPQFDGDWNSYGTGRSTRDVDAKATFEFEGDAIEWRGGLFDDAGTAQVTIDGKEVDIVDQFDPQRGKPFVWKRAGLGPGKHTITIEPTGEKSAQSSDIWINIGELVAPIQLPVFTAADLEKAKLVEMPGAIVALEVQDKAGQTRRLRDFGTAGQTADYFSWLEVDGAPSAAFSRENPSRTATLER